MKYIDYKLLGKIVLFLMLFVGLTSYFIHSVLGVPQALSIYFLYYLAYALFFCVLFYQISIERNGAKILHIPLWELSMIMFLLYILISGLIRRDIFALEYHLRSYLIGYATFCGTILFFDKSKFRKVYLVAYVLLIFHTISSIMESFVVEKADNIGGLFGTTFGASNTASQAFVQLVTMLFLAGYIKEKVKVGYFYSVIALCLVVAAVAELKIYYITLFLYFLLYMLLSKKYIKSLFMIVSLLLLVYVGFSVFVYFHPQIVNFYSLEGIQSYLDDGYAGKTFAVTRTNGFSFIFENLFDGNVFKMVFGNGFAANQADLVKEYNIIYFSYAKVFYYGGIICTLLYYYLPTTVLIRLIRNSSDDRKLFSAIVGMGFLFFAFYSSETMSPAPSVLWFFSLALGMDDQLICEEKR